MKLSLGKFGEQTVISALHQEGFLIVKTNQIFYRQGKKIGEIDIVAEKKDTLYLIEVKTTNNSQTQISWSYQQQSRLKSMAYQCWQIWPKSKLRFGLAWVIKGKKLSQTRINWFYPDGLND